MVCYVKQEKGNEYRKWGLTRKKKCAKVLGMTRKLLTSQEVAQAIGVTPQTVNAWARAGILPYVEVGPKTRRFWMDDILAHLSKNQVGIKEDDNGKAVVEVVD